MPSSCQRAHSGLVEVMSGVFVFQFGGGFTETMSSVQPFIHADLTGSPPIKCGV